MTYEELLKLAKYKVCRGNAPVMLDDPNTVYWVTEGEIEVFLLDSQGQRWPWLTLGTRNWMLGEKTGPENRLAAYATSAEGSKVACLPIDVLEKSAEVFMSHQENLLSQYGGLFGPLAPKDTRSLSVGLKDTLVFENDRCNADRLMVWVQAKDGPLRLLSEDGPLLPKGWFPLFRSVWVFSPQRTHLDTLSTAEVQKLGNWLAGVQLLQSQAYLAACHESEVRRKALSEAVAHRQKANEDALSGGLACLARILPGAEVADPEEADGGLSLQALCRNLEQALAAPFRPA